MTVGVIGHGRFGELAVRYLARHARVYVYDPRVPARRIRRARVIPAPQSVVAAQPVVVLAVPISLLRRTLRSIAPRLIPGSLVVDVCSVKTLPLRWMKEILPRSVSILGTHPLFGPDSAAGSLLGHTIVLCPARISPRQLASVRRLLRREGLNGITMSPDRHDRMMAETILLTQYVGRLVRHARLGRWKVPTPTYSGLLSMVEIAGHDSLQLFADMIRYNVHARNMVRAMRRGARRVETEARRALILL
jgi:prephenate dehydrogenase